MKNHSLVFFISILLLVGFTSCKYDAKKTRINTIKITHERVITEINDSTFLASYVDGIKQYDDCLFFSDFKNHRVLCTDTEYNLLKIFGQAGKGPGDLINPLGCLIHNGELLVYNGGGKRINRYNIHTAKYNGDIPFKNHLTSYRYISFKDALIVSFGWKQKPITVIDYDGNIIRSMGSKDHIMEINKGRQRNFQFANLNDGKHFLAICETEPIIEKYSIVGELVKRFDISGHPEFIDKIRRFSETRKDPAFYNATFTFITDIFYENGMLYILTPSFDDEENKICKLIMIFKVTSEEITPVQNIILNADKDSWYSSFTIYSDKLIAYDVINYEIHQYKLPKLKGLR